MTAPCRRDLRYPFTRAVACVKTTNPRAFATGSAGLRESGAPRNRNTHTPHYGQGTS
ncbi:MAG: hypothetical protein KAS72_02245 [Phycisphaerales bacterium]|nr:hypothetical protein [Phycisphaerales bacterium]